MANKYTENQRLAIETRGGGILVSAAAGSGKTTVLVERILSLLCDEQNPMDADRLLVVTFTNAAAAEMSARLKQALQQRIAEQPKNTRLRRQAMLLGRAQISTVHAFCSALLREHFAHLGIPVDFSLADSLLAAELRERALSQTMDELYADETSGIGPLCDLFGRARSDRDTARLIERLFDFEGNLAFPRKWEAKVLRDLSEDQPLCESAVGRALLHYAAESLETARTMLVDALELASEDEVLETAYSPALRDDLNNVNALAAHVAAKEWDRCFALLSCYEPLALKPVRGVDLTLKNAVSSLRDAVKKILADTLPTNCFIARETEYRADIARMREPVRTLFSALALFERTLMQRKLDRRTLEFCDLERLALTLLCDKDGAPTEAARHIAERFDAILVDEFQDTNEIQDLIFNTLSRDGKNLFFVGDVKQSIYAFRRADPAIFMALRDRCCAAETGLFPQKIALPHNFRSTAGVVEAVNAIFMPLMTNALGGSDYAAPGEALQPREDAPNPDPVGVELMLYKKEEGDLADAVARRIADMLREGYLIEENGALRRCRESDFCILLRSAKTRAPVYLQALARAGLRSQGGGGDFFQSSEVSVILALLRVVDNPRRDADLAAVLLSPLFALTPDDLARLRVGDRRAPLYALLAASEVPRTRECLDVLAEFRRARTRLPVGELIQHICDALGAEIALCAGGDYAERRDNLRMLIDYAEQFAARSGGSLAAFLRMCESAAAAGQELRRAPPASSDAVSVTTIHRAKGLEWPVVILADAEKPFNQSDSRDSVMLFDAALGVGGRLRTETGDGAAVFAHRTLHYAALSLQSKQKTTGEEMRVLYVALTRARQKLLVAAALSDPQKTLLEWRSRTLRAITGAAQVSRPVDWVGLALLSHSGRFAELLPGESIAEAPLALSLPLPPEEGAPLQEAQNVPHVAADADTVLSLQRRLGFVYDRAPLFDVPVKLAVTALAKGDDASHTLYRPSFARGGLTAAQRGSALHLFMQCADYAAAAQSVEGELQRLVEGEYLTPEMAESIDKTKLRAFFGSALGQKVLSPHTLREYAFIDAIPAGRIKDLPPPLCDTEIMVQGIADCIVPESDGAILVDYKSDRVQSPDELLHRYRAQLLLYRAALDKRLPVPIKQCLIYSFALGQAIEIE